MSTESKRQELEGIVRSSKGDKTITVSVPHMVQHPKYKKYLRKESVFRVHDEKNDAKQGDRVVIRESRPISRTKCWRLKKVVERAQTI